jgi:hypothetical protein
VFGPVTWVSDEIRSSRATRIYKNPCAAQLYGRQGGTMNHKVGVIVGIGLDHKTRKSRWPARLDLIQSASGLFLGLFMWGHMAFVSSILISKM